MDLYYLNKKGKKVVVEATTHSINRFRERFRRVEPNCKKSDEEMFEKLFNNAVVLDVSKEKNKKYKKRKSKHSGDDSVYLRSGSITFVVKNAQIVTVELSGSLTRSLN